MSDTAKKMAGTFIPDDQTQRPPVAAWVQQELRSGALRHVIERFAKEQSESLDPKMVVVEGVSAEGIRCRIPCAVCDHESTRPMRYDVEFDLNPLNGQALRRSGS